MSSGLQDLYEALKANSISRRDFLEKASVVAGSTTALFLANAAHISAAGGSQNGFAVYTAADGTPAVSPVASPVLSDTVPAEGTENQTRGQGGELKLIQWQAPSGAFVHVATGTTDFNVGSLVSEPLLMYTPSGTLVPWLAEEVPSVETGTLAKDLTNVTFRLQKDLKWSDGQPVTSKDVKFTWQWIIEPGNASVSAQTWENVKDIEIVDDLTVKVTYKAPSAAWFEPFTDYVSGPIIPSHVFKDDPKNINLDFVTKPIGTGPFKIDEFKPQDSVKLSANEHYRDPKKPFFATISLKGGGDATAAARSVMETGEYHFAWNLQVEPKILKNMEAGGKGKVVVAQGTSLERIHINMSDPNKEVNGQKSEVNTPHPFLTDPAVRGAMNLAIDRERIATEFYGPGQPATANVLNGIESFTSTNTSWKFDLDAASKMLDDAGWKMDGKTRKKDGVELKVVYATTVNPVRQKTQAVVKQGFEKIGIKTELKQIDAAIFFDGSVGNDQNINHFYWDINMYTNNPTSTVPVSFLQGWYAGKDNVNVAQKSNNWNGQNPSRYVNKDYDAKYDALKKATDIDEASKLAIEMNDILINDVACIPLVNRSADTYAFSVKLREANITVGPLNSTDYWNIANWNFAEGVTSWDS